MSKGITPVKIPNPKSLSRLGPRGTFGLALVEIAQENENVIGVVADLAITAGMDRFRQQFPERFINVGIAEQNLIGIASGLADDGKLPFAVSFANFTALRACEFVRHHLGYMNQNVVAVGIGAGFAMGQFGTTHYSIEDIGALRSIPDITIITPADGTEIYEAMEALINAPRPTYLRLNGAPGMPIVDQSGTKFEIGKARVLSTGRDLTIIASGSMVSVALEVHKSLSEIGLNTSVVNMHTVKPLDPEPVLNAARIDAPIVTIEEHSVIGGLGSAVAELLTSVRSQSRLLRLGVDDTFPTVGSYEYVLNSIGLNSKAIHFKVMNFVSGSS